MYIDKTTVLTAILKNTCKNKYNLNLKASTVEDYKALTTAFTTINIEFFIFNMRVERSVKYLIKYIPTDLPIEDIQKNLIEQNISYNSVNFLTKADRRETRRLPLLLLNAPRSSVNAIQELTDICHIDIKTELYNNKDLGQCYRCQSYGHSSTNCIIIKNQNMLGSLKTTTQKNARQKI